MQHGILQLPARWRSSAGLLLALLLLMASAPTGAAAQRLESYGVRGGLSLAQVRGGAVSGVQVGATAGASLRIGLGGGFALQPELLYVRKGGSGEEDEIEDVIPVGGFGLQIDEVAVATSVRADYVEVPLLVHYAIPTDGRFAPSLVAGPYAALGFGRAAGAEVRGRFAVLNPADEEIFAQVLDDYQDLEDLLQQVNALADQFGVGADLPETIDGDRFIERLDYGLTLGTDLGFPLGGQRAVLSLRYDLGLRDVVRQDADEVAAIQQILGAIDDFEGAGFEGRTNTLTVALGVAF